MIAQKCALWIARVNIDVITALRLYQNIYTKFTTFHN